MANSIQGNKIYLDSTGVVTDKRTKVAYIVFTAGSNNDIIVLRETASGDDIVKLMAANPLQTEMYDFSAVPLVFNNGIYVESISAGAAVMLVTTQGSGGS